ncbi:MAG: tetratricopeptide repeat protein [Planctomycetota bacterium]
MANAPDENGPTHVEAPPERRAPFALIEESLVEFQALWQAGDAPRAEEAFERHPELLKSPEAALRIIFEEISQRRDRGDAITFGEYYNRFPQWHTAIHGFLDVKATAPFAAPSQESSDQGFSSFEIVTDLGRGSGGRVYLARQPELSNRLVVLKVSNGEDLEHLSLARLQHTNIVPLYGVVENAATHQRALCMPYFGATTLYHILSGLSSIPLEKRRSADLFNILEERERRLSLPETDRKAAPESRRDEPFVQTVCRIGAALAQALADAHRVGLLHLDIKPPNILVTTDGTAMLLDFHLARAPLVPGTPPPRLFGGSPPFMSPEQTRACADVQDDRPISSSVDARADIYSLGMALCVALTDSAPRPECKPADHLRASNRTVSVGLADIVARCLEHDPASRYADARQLAEDLRRHLHDEPLAHVPNRNWQERWSKWRRRRPHALPLAALSLALVLAMAIGWGFAEHSLASRRQAAESMYFQGQVHLQENRFAPAADAFAQALETLPGGGDAPLRTAIDRGLAAAQRAQYIQRLSSVVDAMRLAMFSEPIDYRSMIVLDVNSKSLWDDRQRILNDRRTPDFRLAESLRRELTDLALDRADLLPKLAPPQRADEYRARAAKLLEEARSVSPIPRVIDWWAAEKVEEIPETRSAWESYMLGRALMRRGSFDRALPILDDAVRQEPAEYWPNFALAMCALKLKQPARAIPPLSVCIGRRPLQDAPYVYRAEAFASLQQWEPAAADFDQALRLRPNIPQVLLERGKTLLALDRHAEALSDFRTALDLGSDPNLVAPWMTLAEKKAVE